MRCFTHGPYQEKGLIKRPREIRTRGEASPITFIKESSTTLNASGHQVQHSSDNGKVCIKCDMIVVIMKHVSVIERGEHARPLGDNNDLWTLVSAQSKYHTHIKYAQRGAPYMGSPLYNQDKSFFSRKILSHYLNFMGPL
jgi:hypothetical protein